MTDPAIQPQAVYDNAVALLRLRRLDEARRICDAGAEQWPSNFNFLHLGGIIALEAGQPRRAIELLGRAIQINPRDAMAHAHHGNALWSLADYPGAVASYDAAIALAADYAEAYNGRGSALAAMLNRDAALASFDEAIAACGHFAEAHLNRGNVLKELGRPEDAAASYERAVAINPDFAQAHYRLADLRRHQGRLEEALAAYDRAVALERNAPSLLGMRCHVRMQLCDWRDFDADVTELAASIERGEPTCPPLAVLAFSGSGALQRRAAQAYVHSEYPPDPTLPSPIATRRAQRIKIGYFSPDFREHPVAHLTAGLFESHDRAMFEVTALSLGPDVDDAMTRRLKGGFERFVNVHGHSDRDVAQLSRELQLDIAVDLCGFTEGCRPGIFAKRAAPLQLSYLGYLGTMAAPYIDYLIADATLVPPDSRAHYTERLITLPTYHASNLQRRVAVCDRETYGLPRTGFVFCCFNNPYKITPATFSGWMRILEGVADSVLFLYAPHARVATNLRQEAASRGVDPARLVFGHRLPRAEYLERYAAADLFLDTLPYNAGTTASDALSVGLPVLTLTGATIAGRMAASLLNAAGIPELITSTQEHYEALAVELALDRDRFAQIRARMSADQFGISPLFDVRRFASHLESAYQTIHEIYRAGLPPTDVTIALPRIR